MDNAVLVICGSINKYEEEYVKGLLKEAQGKANIVVAGYLPKKALYKYMEMADCAFMPFCFDECPIALTECIGHGLPVITNEYAGYERSIIDTFGYCARHNDAEDYAKGLLRTLSDEEYNSRKRKGAMDVAREFNFDRFKEELNDVFE
jgi:glycosyltransferase involved in cell wall biosynthesis